MNAEEGKKDLRCEITERRCRWEVRVLQLYAVVRICEHQEIAAGANGCPVEDKSAGGIRK